MAALPLIKPHCGLRLPPDRHCLLSVNYKLRASEAQPKKMTKSALERPLPKNKSIGAAILKRQSLGSIPKSQTVNIPKPVFKFSASSNGKAGSSAANASTPATKAPTQPSVASHIIQEVKMEIEEDYGVDPKGIKRKRDDEDDDFEVVG